MRRIQLVSLVLSCSVLGGGLLTPAPAVAQPANGAIAFVTGRGAELFEIWEMDADGVDPDPLITGPPGSIEVDPAWNPTGTEVAFARKARDDETYDLLRKPVPTGTAVKLTDENDIVATDRQPAWSSSEQIAFTRVVRADDTSHIWRINADGTVPTQLTATPTPGYDASPTWSPDGLEIAFVSDRIGGISQIFTMDSGGITETQRTFDACFAGSPAWKPDDPLNDVIVYERLCPGSGTGWDIWELNVTAGTNLPLTSTAENDHQPAWSPDGMKIVFTRYGSDGDKDLWIMDPINPAGASPTAGGADPQADLSADWGTNTMLRVEATSVEVAEETAVGRREAASDDHRRSRKQKRKRRDRPIPRKVIKGVRYLDMRAFRSDVHVLKVSPRLVPRLDVALSNDLLPGHERTSSMARRHTAVAAINGDFGTPSGRPSHTFAEDGDLKQVSFAVAPTFAMTQDELTTHIGRPFETVTAKETDAWQVERWNFGEPGFTDIAGYTPASGTLEVPPANACSARLQAASGRRWAPGLAGVEVDFQVTEVACATTAFGLPAPGQVVLSAQPGSDAGIMVNSLSLGETVTVTWSIGFAGVLDTVGGLPLLLENGVNVVPRPCSTAVCNKHPRTGIGVTATGRILLVVVDGRRSDSRGITLVQFGNLMASLHAVHALNLDGGGSSTMWVDPKGPIKGRVVNVPSDGQQRKVSSAVLVLKGADPGEAIGAPLARTPEAGAAPAPARDQAGELAAMDPASTGGLAEAMAEGTFGPRVDLPRELRRALRLFRSAN